MNEDDYYARRLLVDGFMESAIRIQEREMEVDRCWPNPPPPTTEEP